MADEVPQAEYDELARRHSALKANYAGAVEALQRAFALDDDVRARYHRLVEEIEMLERWADRDAGLPDVSALRLGVP